MCNFEYSPQYIALAQLYKGLQDGFVKKKKLFLEGMTKRGLDVHYAVPTDAPVAQYAPELVGCTALHLAIRVQDEEAVEYLIQQGAKVTVTNDHGHSPIRLALEYRWQERNSCLRTKGMIKHPVVKSLLEVQYQENDGSNPPCKLGLTHLHIACMVDDAKMVEFLLRSGASAEAMISADSPHLAGYRPLHVAVRYCAVESLKLLLNSGADISSREARGLNPLELLIECNLELSELVQLHCMCTTIIEIRLVNQRMANLILTHCSAESLQLEYGLERLHVAASMRDNNMVVELLTANPEIDVNAAISVNSPNWPGYTPLHFVARCGVDMLVVKALIERGANLAIVDVSGITPFDFCVMNCDPIDLYEIMQLEEILKSITFETSCTTVCKAVRALNCLSDVKEFVREMSNVDDPVSLDSPLWPGFTLLHLAVTLMPKKYEFEKLNYEFNVLVTNYQGLEDAYKVYSDVMRYLQNRGANPIAQDVRNSSPVHLAFRRNRLDTVKQLLNTLVHLNSLPFDNVTDSDGLSLLHISSAANIPEIAEALLSNNAGVNARTKSGLSLSVNDDYGNLELYLNSGSTPLHFALVFQSASVAELLIRNGADPLAVDDNKLTPIFLSFITRSIDFGTSLVRKLFSVPSVLKSDVVSIGGLSHFHLTCCLGNVTTVKSFLDLGADVNAKINCDLNDACAENPWTLKSALTRYAGYTPLHFATLCRSVEVIALLVERGADVHAQDAQGISPLHMALLTDAPDTHLILRHLLTNVDKSNCGSINDSGITLLHIACWLLDKVWVEQLVTAGADVNAQISANSFMWPGDTPLHIIGKRSLGSRDLEIMLVSEIIKLLATQSADLSLPNNNNDTPLHCITDMYDQEWNLIRDIPIPKTRCYDVNRMNSQGLALIHLGCMCDDVKMVTELLIHGADINRPVDYFAEKFGGYTPLHFAFIINNSSMVQLLIEKGANASAEDCYGSTHLHVICQSYIPYSNYDHVTLTLRHHGVNINARDIYGRTPLELLMQRSPKLNNLFNTLMNCGARLNTVNPVSEEAPFPGALSRGWFSAQLNLLEVSDTDILAVMDDGSTAIHNSVRGYYCNEVNFKRCYLNLIEDLLTRGCYINAQDNRGRTALHVALEHDNFGGVCSLLAAGINVNIADNDKGNVALGLRSNNHRIRLVLLMHLHKLTSLGLELSEPNRRLYEAEPGLVRNYHLYETEPDLLPNYADSEIGRMEQLKLHRNFSLREFLTERALRDYDMIPRVAREAIVQRLASSELYEEFPGLRSPIRYQYRRLLERIDLIESAKDVFRLIMGNNMPDLCLDSIIIYLNNEELKTLKIVIEKPLQNDAASKE